MINFLNKVDQNVFLWMNGFHWGFLDRAMVFLSGQMIWLPFVMFFLWKGKITLEKRSFWVFFFFIAITLMLSDVTSSYILKNIFTRLRPCRVAELKPLIYNFGQKCGGKFGFVSSHAANSAALVVFCLRSLRLPKGYRVLCALPVVVGASRIYLGVHYPGDVICGVIVGTFWATVLATAFQKSTAQA